MLAFATIGAFVYWLRGWRLRRAERQRASEDRLAALMAHAMASVQPKAATRPDAIVAKQRLIFDAACKAGEAGEPVLAIQLYARLLARFPECGFADQARRAIEEQKRLIAKA